MNAPRRWRPAGLTAARGAHDPRAGARAGPRAHTPHAHQRQQQRAAAALADTHGSCLCQPLLGAARLRASRLPLRVRSAKVPLDTGLP